MINSEYISAELLLAVPLLWLLDSALDECTDLCDDEIMGLVFLAGVVLALIYTLCVCDVDPCECCEAVLVAVIEGLIIAALAYFCKCYLCPGI
ncbi:MAG TPA: hypothetical protein DER23_07825 [Clostridiales bacterium]|jgi:hypothetical protein|nr:hypothetical protein [Clostridiales bacterium]HCG36235.1 hypothetical protein [Clostridiales bacterium]